MLIRSIFILFMAFSLNACSETEFISHVIKTMPGNQSNETAFKVGKPYKIDGKYYTPKETYSFSETGIASWYGPNFHGKKTANGEIYNQYQLTAAHRTLQLPSIVRVTNLENGRSVKLRVNDRGPFSKGRIIDVSKKGAELLGFKNQGTARVRVDVLAKESQLVADYARRGEKLEVHDLQGKTRMASADLVAKPQPITQMPTEQEPSVTVVTPSNNGIASVETEQLQTPTSVSDLKPVETTQIDGETVDVMPVKPTNMFVQVGSFSVYDNAYRLAGQLQNMGLDSNVGLSQALINGRQFYRVRIGPLDAVEKADTILNRVWHEKGLTDAHIVVDEQLKTQ